MANSQWEDNNRPESGTPTVLTFADLNDPKHGQEFDIIKEQEQVTRDEEQLVSAPKSQGETSDDTKPAAEDSEVNGAADHEPEVRVEQSLDKTKQETEFHQPEK